MGIVLGGYEGYPRLGCVLNLDGVELKVSSSGFHLLGKWRSASAFMYQRRRSRHYGNDINE